VEKSKVENREKAIRMIKSAFDIIKEKGFAIHPYEEKDVYCGIEIEDQTSDGVNMIHFLDFRNKEFGIYSLCYELYKIYEGFDVDNEIAIHRQDEGYRDAIHRYDEGYRDAFRISQSVRDFERWEKRLKDLSNSVNAVRSKYEMMFDEDFSITLSEVLSTKEDALNDT